MCAVLTIAALSEEVLRLNWEGDCFSWANKLVIAAVSRADPVFGLVADRSKDAKGARREEL